MKKEHGDEEWDMRWRDDENLPRGVSLEGADGGGLNLHQAKSAKSQVQWVARGAGIQNQSCSESAETHFSFGIMEIQMNLGKFCQWPQLTNQHYSDKVG